MHSSTYLYSAYTVSICCITYGDYTKGFLQKKTYIRLYHNLCLYFQVIFCIVPGKMMKHEMIRFEIIWNRFRLLWVALGGEEACPDNRIQKPGKESWTLVMLSFVVSV